MNNKDKDKEVVNSDKRIKTPLKKRELKRKNTSRQKSRLSSERSKYNFLDEIK